MSSPEVCGLARGLTTQLNGRPRPPLRTGEHTIHCENGLMSRGPLQRVVSLHAASIDKRRKRLRSALFEHHEAGSTCSAALERRANSNPSPDREAYDSSA